MRRTSRCSWLVTVTVLAVCGLYASRAHALPFSSSCDRIEIDGNEFGPADGAFDFVDDFANASLAPEWTVLLGTASESGGAAVVRDPGTSILLGGTVLEISTIENEVHGISDGSGNFTMVSHWLPTLPATNAEFHMQLYAISPIVEAAGITVNNNTPEMAAQLGGGALAGYSVSESVTQGFGSSFTTVQFHAMSISPGAVTGEIVLRMTFDDATNLLTCAFSLDGGTTFQNPFPSMHIFNGGVNDYDVLLGAAAAEQHGSLPPPTVVPLPLKIFDLDNPSGPTSRRLRYTAKATELSGASLGNPAASGATLHVQVDGESQCFALPPGSLWSVGSNGSRLTYKDSSGAYGPVKLAQMRRSTHGVVQTKAIALGRLGAITLVPPNPGARADVRLQVGGGPAFCASTAGGTTVKNDAQAFRVKNAPAPPTCIPACSPSGAFVE